MNSFSDAFEQPILEVGKKGHLRLLNELVPYVHSPLLICIFQIDSDHPTSVNFWEHFPHK